MKIRSLGINSLSLTSTDFPAVRFESITFSDGTVIALEPNDVIVLVGPNNAGKSAALRELQEHIAESFSGDVVKKVSLYRTGSIEQVQEAVKIHFKKSGVGPKAQYSGFGTAFTEDVIESLWLRQIQALRGIFCQWIKTESRILDSNPQPSINILDDLPSHPIHVMFKDDRIAQVISSFFRRAFGKDLMVFHLGGGSWPLLVGECPRLEPGEHLTSATYLERQRTSAVPLHSQGDGMRSFATVILHLLMPNMRSILLLDEPEAFLHPPQARLLGEFIAQERSSHVQLFVATHSPDVLQGLLGATPENLRVLRIQRDGVINRVKELDRRRAKQISADPLMKFSSVLSGVFYKRVIICESDADCMFYSAILDLPEVRGPQQPDVLFVQAAGKDRIASLAETLRALDVDVDVIADIDVLKDEATLRRLIEALGGDWGAIRAEARPLKLEIEQHKPWLNSAEVAKGVQEILDHAPAIGEFPKRMQDEIRGLFRKASPWDAIKDAGRAAIPAGIATERWQHVRTLSKAAGLWIVPVGELEGFCKSVGGHGPRWVQQVLETRNLATDQELAEARSFVSEVWHRLEGAG